MKKNVLWSLIGFTLVLALSGCPDPTGAGKSVCKGLKPNKKSPRLAAGY